MKQSHYIQRFLCLFLCCILSFSLLNGCTSSQQNSNNTSEQFDRFLNNYYTESVSDSSLSLHFALEDPKAYGIQKDSVPSFQDITTTGEKAFHAQLKKVETDFLSFDRNSLSKKQQHVYDILKEYLSLTTVSNDYDFYPMLFGNDGIQSSIPSTLSEYYFTDEEDIKIYLKILKDLPAFFDEAIQYEKEREKKGIFLSQRSFDHTIAQIDQFLSVSQKDNILISNFEKRINHLDFLSSEQKKSYCVNNRMLVKDVVFPAYKNLKKNLRKNVTISDTTERICQYPNGKKYYEFLLKYQVGTSMDAQKCFTVCKNMLTESYQAIANLKKENPDIINLYYSSSQKLSSPKDILQELFTCTNIDFPVMDSIPYELYDIPEALSSTRACAFYILPTIDGKNNTIFLNNSRINSSDLYSTLAHEGYPGHMYQTNYFYKHMYHPIQTCLRNQGYDEGWGTYSQLYSYKYLDFKDTDKTETAQLRRLYKEMDLLSLNIAACSDLYVNYYNYSLNDLKKELSSFALSEDNIESLYNYVIEKPTSYLSYAVGYYEFCNLYQNLRSGTQKDLTIADYHQAVLDAGSCPFYLLSDYVKDSLISSKQ